MISLLIRSELQHIENLRERLDRDRRALHEVTHATHAQISEPLRSPWALPTAFAAGVGSGLLGRWPRKIFLSTLPLYKMALTTLMAALR